MIELRPCNRHIGLNRPFLVVTDSLQTCKGRPLFRSNQALQNSIQPSSDTFYLTLIKLGELFEQKIDTKSNLNKKLASRVRRRNS